MSRLSADGVRSRARSRRGSRLATREADGDWRDHMVALDGPPVKLRTHVTEENPKTILSFNQSPDIFFDRSINAYRGCEHPNTVATYGKRIFSLICRGLASN